MAAVLVAQPVARSAPVTVAVVSRHNPAPNGWSSYVVRAGDTVRALALRARTSEAVIVSRNRLPYRGGLIRVGQRLQIPRAHAAPAAPRRPSAGTASYVVRTGDTMSAIAVRHRMSLASLLKRNRMPAGALIHPGQRVAVTAAARRPAAASPAASPAASTAAYRVRAGDTMSGIAAHRHVSLATLLKLNRMPAAALIRPGQRVLVPSPSSNTFAGRTYSDAVVTAAERNRESLRRAGVPTRVSTRAMIVSTARRHGVDPRLALAVAWQESGWSQSQVSVANAIGVMQVIPTSGQWASQMAGRQLDLLRTQDNITAGVVILRSLTRSAATLDEAIAGYYQGLGSVQKNGMYADTRQYVKSIKAHRAHL